MTQERRPNGLGKDAEIGFARNGGGESGGGGYDNPHAGKKGDNSGFMGHGGQTDQPYHGGEQLGEQAVGDGANPNSATQKTRPGQRDDAKGE